MPTTINLQNLITAQAAAQGVPPSIALGVAQQESGIAQWKRDGSLVTGADGEIGVFQLLPSSFPGVDSADLTTNISTGVGYLAQLFRKYGNWPAALSAYNSGSPTGSPSYASSVLSIAGAIDSSGAAASPSLPDSAGGTSGGILATDGTIFGVDPNTLLIGGLAALGLLLWWLEE
jgi:hypothetical protein